MHRKGLISTVMILTFVLSLIAPGVPAYAEGHCVELRQQVNKLRREAEDLERDLKASERDLDSLFKDVLKQMKAIAKVLDSMPTLGENAEAELKRKFGEDAAKEVAKSVFLMVLAPELLPARLVAALSLIDSLNDGYEMISALQDAIAIINEMFSLGGGANESLTEAYKFAKDNDLPQLKKLIDAFAALPKMQERLQELWDRWLNAGVNVESLKSRLDAKRAELQAAADALDSCVQKDETENDPCDQDLSPSGVGTCR